jgi:phosphohistidine phosphatase
MKLWLIRHAKSDWDSGALRDFDRPLNRRGERDGPNMAAWLATQSDPAVWIWTSDAVRALATARFVADGFAAAGPRIVEDHRLYNAPPETILDVIRETPPDVAAAAVVAHNPGMTQTLNLLVGETVTVNLPTFGVARLDVPASWPDVAYGTATVDLTMRPKALPD